MMRVVFLVYCSSALLCDALKLLSQAQDGPDIYVKAGCTLEVCEFFSLAVAPESGYMCTDVSVVAEVWTEAKTNKVAWDDDFVAALAFKTDADGDAPFVLDNGNDGTVMAVFAGLYADGLDQEGEEALAVAYWNVAEVIYGVMFPSDQTYVAWEFFTFENAANTPTVAEFDMVDASVGFYVSAYYFTDKGSADVKDAENDVNLGFATDNVCVTGDLEVMVTQSDAECDDKDTAGTCDLFDGELVATLIGYDLLAVEAVDILSMTNAATAAGAKGLVATDAILGTLPSKDDCDPAKAGNVCTNLVIYKWADSVCSMGSAAFDTDELCSGFVLDLNDNREQFVEFMTAGECWLVDIDPDADLTDAAGAGTAGMRSCFPSGPMSIYNDPKVTNLQGQKFEIMSTGTFSMLTVKESTRSLLDISATIDRAGSRCGATYIQNLTLNGEWIEQLGAPQIHMRATAAVPKPKSLQYSIDGDKTWHQPSELHWKNTLRKEKGHLDLSFGNVRIEVNIDSHRIVDAGVKTARFANFLNMNVKGANKLQSKYMLTGLLAHDDHRAVSALPSGCSSVKLLSTVTVTATSVIATSDVSRKPELKKKKKTKARTNGMPKPDVMKRIHSNKRFKENKRLAGKLSEEREHKKKMSKSQKEAEGKKITEMYVSNKKNHKKRQALGKKAHSMR